MRYDFEQLDARIANRLMTALITPRPIAWVVTENAAGIRNAAPFSFFNALCSWPPIIGMGIQSRLDGSVKDTRANIEATGEFVVNLVPYHAAEQMNRSSYAYPPDIDELQLLGIETLPSARVRPPRIVSSPVAFECRLRQMLPIEEDRAIVLGNVLTVHVDDVALIDPAQGTVDGAALDLVARMHGSGFFVRTRDMFVIPRPDPETFR